MPRPAKTIPFGKYELLEKIAVGGMAEIFKARTKGVGGFEKYLAIKRILPHLSENKDFIDMLINEAKIAVRLSHANIVQIYDLGKIDDSYFIAMEYIEGKDLRAVMQRCEEIGMPLFVQHAVFVTIEACKGLEYAHSKSDTDTSAGGPEALNIVHRDISPQNIMISYEGEVKITDFGIAKASVNVNQTEAGVVKGKYEYMSPEQASGLPVDRRTDIFSLGIVLYEMLTGVRPFRGDSDLTILERVREARVDPPSKYNKSVPRKLEKLVLKALSKEPADRFQSATEFKDELTRFFYSSTFNFTTSNLASYMKSIFSEEIRLDVTIDVEGTGARPRPNLEAETGETNTHSETGESLDANELIDIEQEVNKILVPGKKSEDEAEPAATPEETELSMAGDEDEAFEEDSDSFAWTRDSEEFPMDAESFPETQSGSETVEDDDLPPLPELGDEPPVGAETDTRVGGFSGTNGRETTGATAANLDPLDQETETRANLDPLESMTDNLDPTRATGSSDPLEQRSDTLVPPSDPGVSGGAETVAGAARSSRGGSPSGKEATVITESHPSAAPSTVGPGSTAAAAAAARQASAPPSVAVDSPPGRPTTGGGARGPKIKHTPRVVKERVRGRTVNATDIDDQIGVGSSAPAQPRASELPTQERPRSGGVPPRTADQVGSESSRPTSPTPQTTGERTVIGVKPRATPDATQAGPPPAMDGPPGGTRPSVPAARPRASDARTGTSSVTLGVQVPTADMPLTDAGGTNISANPLDVQTADIMPPGARIQEPPGGGATGVGPPSMVGGTDSVMPMEKVITRARLHPMVLLACVSVGFAIGVAVTLLLR